MNEQHATQLNSPGWLLYTRVSFAIALVAMAAGVWLAPTTVWVKGYLGMGALFLMGTSFTLAKTLRDEFEAGKLVNRIADARTDAMLKEYEPDLPS